MSYNKDQKQLINIINSIIITINIKKKEKEGMKYEIFTATGRTEA